VPVRLWQETTAPDECQGNTTVRDEDKLVLEMCKRNGDSSRIRFLIQSDAFKWRYFLELAAKHRIAPYVLNRLMEYPLPQSRRMFLKDLHRKVLIKTSLDNRAFKAELTCIKDALDANGIESILMKGPSLDFSQLRTIGDLDILVRKEKLLQAVNVLGEIDYMYAGDTLNRFLTSKEKKDISLQLSWNNQFQMISSRSELLVELHINLFEKERAYAVDLDELLDNIDIFWEHRCYNEKLGCYTFIPEHALLLACIHNAVKRCPANNTFIMRNIIDIDSLIEHGIDWDSFVETSVILDTAHFVYFSLLLTVGLIDTDVPEDVLNELRSYCSGWQLFLTVIHLKSFHSLESNSMFYSTVYKVLNPFVNGKRWRDRIKWLFLIPVLFPPRRRMERRFNLKKDSPLVYAAYLLNPFRWVYLIVKNATRK